MDDLIKKYPAISTDQIENIVELNGGDVLMADFELKEKAFDFASQKNLEAEIDLKKERNSEQDTEAETVKEMSEANEQTSNQEQDQIIEDYKKAHVISKEELESIAEVIRAGAPRGITNSEESYLKAQFDSDFLKIQSFITLKYEQEKTDQQFDDTLNLHSKSEFPSIGGDFEKKPQKPLQSAQITKKVSFKKTSQRGKKKGKGSSQNSKRKDPKDDIDSKKDPPLETVEEEVKSKNLEEETNHQVFEEEKIDSPETIRKTSCKKTEISQTSKTPEASVDKEQPEEPVLKPSKSDTKEVKETKTKKKDATDYLNFRYDDPSKNIVSETYTSQPINQWNRYEDDLFVKGNVSRVYPVRPTRKLL